MVPSNLAYLQTSVSTAEALFSGYINAWSRLPLRQIQIDPFSSENLTLTLREGLQNGIVQCSSLALFAASHYTERAKSYERVLLESLGLDTTTIDALVARRASYIDHFSEESYPWQTDAFRAGVVVSEMTSLGASLEKAAKEIAEWKKSVGFYPDAGDHFDFKEILSEPLQDLQSILDHGVRYARMMTAEHDLTSARGLSAYFGQEPRRASGMRPALRSSAYAVYDSSFPPAAE